MIQDQLSSIVRKFKENEYYQYSANKQNNYRMQSSKIEPNSSKQQVQSLSKKVKYLQNVIEKMIMDGNKMHRYYQEMLIESATQFQTFKQEYHGYRCSTSQQKKEGQNLVQYLNAKIDTLSRQISNKQELYGQLLYKYEQLEERATEAHLQETEHVKDIENQLARESMHRQQQRILTNKQIQQMKKDLQQAIDNNEQLLNENNYLKNINESLAHNIEYLKNKLYAENNIIHQSGQQDNHLSMIQLERCDVDSISRQEDRLTLEQIKMNESHENIFHGQKQLLNLSEYYCKFNRTQQFLSKQKSNYEFVMMDSNQRKSFVKRKDLVSQNRNLLIKIDSIQSKNEEPDIKSRHITEIKQFEMQQTLPIELIVDPYKAFFTLLIQCEKLNSPHFEKISHIDFSYLYPQLIKAFIPYNKWQDNIRNELLGKIHKKN